MEDNIETTGDDWSARKRELLEKAVEYASEHGITETSLRPLAAAIGSSPRVLLYLFGSKQELFVEIFTICRERQFNLLLGALEATDDTAEALWHLWKSWLADPKRRALMRLFFDNYVHSMYGHEPYREFGPKSVDQWLEALEPMAPDGPPARRSATLTLAVLRGLLLDILATGDTERVDDALRSFLWPNGSERKDSTID
ncbi:TetR/AcrR family transcriptional regulator [Stackebrandtia nassauensis]|uniref:Transcriptional regulator, TetR family n=1 Tax=Stackebrandtia nassauensis (strain DSM 44728 / CIP 108903 / NRRL B-16338 / NBRC 102104 / LLR-40K-21) TaxID=446470 RepID=D3Q4T4_STANL|nr:TetR/AcrR family transcriptional regulator [Stackebrandtia nassauensis]ADD42114.1 transcriptional regulator, TetR family [Stackebrandtia nassauensis DSM 44728]